jgi:hypothetical protein
MSSEQNVAWPSQATIARRAKMSVRQVGRILKTLEADGWLFRAIPENRRGHQWRLTTYRPAVPDAVSHHVRQHPWESNPGWKRADTQMSSPSGNGADTQMSSPPCEQPVDKDEAHHVTPCPSVTAEDISSTEVRTFGAEGEDIRRPKVRTFRANVRTSRCPTKSSSEVSIGRPHRKTPCVRRAGARDTHGAKDENVEKRRRQVQQAVSHLVKQKAGSQPRRPRK